MNNETIKRAVKGNEAAIKEIYLYLKNYSANLKESQKDLLKAEKCSIILTGLDYRMSNEGAEKWGKLLDDMVIKILSTEITNLN